MAYRIYLVDDDKFLRDLYALKFKNAGHTTTGFSGGEELLAELRKHGTAPDAIILDVIMPGLTGFETLQTIRKEHLAEGAKMIVLTNQGTETDLEEARKLSVDGYIIKASAIPSEVLAEVVRIIKGEKPTPVSL